MSRRYTILAIIALALFGCVREEQAEEPALKTFNCFTVSVEETEMTKAHMEDGGAVKWDVGDCIGVFSDTQAPVPFYRREDGKFYGEAVTGTKFYAYFPFNDPIYPIRYDSDNPTILKLESSWSGFCDNARTFAPMVAVSDNNSLCFKQTCGLLHFKIESEYEIASIQLISNSNELFNGRGSINLLDESPIYVLDAGNGTSIEGSSWDINGAYPSMWASPINYGKTIDAFFPIPPMTFKQGFTVQAFFQDYNDHYGDYYEKSTLKTVEISRGQMKTYSILIQAPGQIALSIDKYTFPTEGGEKEITISTDGEWTVTEAPEWCTISATSGSGNSTLSIRASSNDGAQRGGRLAFTCRQTVAYLDITQLPAKGWQYQKFVHKSLFMMFTSVYCGYSVMMNEKIHQVDGLVGNKYHRVDLYESSLGESELVFSEEKKLTTLYYAGTPSGVLDFRRFIYNTEAYSTETQDVFVAAIRQQEELYPAVTGITFNSSVSGNILSVEGTVYSHVADNFKITIYLLEDNVEEFSIRHNDVLRLSLTDAVGDSFTIASQNETYDFQYNISLPAEYKKEDLSLLVIVSRLYGNQIVVKDYYVSDYYVDNCRKAKLGEEAKLELSEMVSGGGNEGIDVGDEIIL